MNDQNNIHLKLKERVDIALEIGESHYREFKSGLQGRGGGKTPRGVSDIKRDIAKTLVAFANADGGELFVGIEDDGSISGLPHPDEDIKQILAAPKDCVHPDTPVPLKRASVIDYDGRKIVHFSVNKGSEFVHLTSKGECFRRHDMASEPTASEKITFDRAEKASREYDGQIVDLAAITDLDLDLLQSVAREISKSISPEKLLQYLDLAEFDGTALKLRKAALLLFAKKSSKWHPRSQVRILKVRGTEEKTGTDFNVTEIGEANGNIFQLIEGSWDLLRPHLADTRFSSNGLFRTQTIYPEMACREALINAITHRDYSNEGRGIEVKIFDDRLQIENPGELLSPISLDKIKSLSGVHLSRNAHVARVLRETDYIRELGEGIKRIFDLMKNNDLIEPDLESSNGRFRITLYYKHVYSKEEQRWLDNFTELNLSREQKTVARLGIDSRLVSAKEIFDSVGIVDERIYRELVESMRALGILENAITRNQVTQQAKKYGGMRKAVPRYRVCVPANQPNGQLRFEADDSEYAGVYVGNIPLNATAADIQKVLSKFGEIVDIRIPQSPYGNDNRGYCFVEFDRKLQANNALNSSTPVSLKGRNLLIRPDKSR